MKQYNLVEALRAIEDLTKIPYKYVNGIYAEDGSGCKFVFKTINSVCYFVDLDNMTYKQISKF